MKVKLFGFHQSFDKSEQRTREDGSSNRPVCDLKLSLFRSRSPIVAGTPSGPVFSPAPPHPLSPPLAFASPVENPSPSQFRRRGPVVSGLEPCAPKIPAPVLSPA
ncbi:unnamed protein product [Brassica rapa subsp. narinosa]